MRLIIVGLFVGLFLILSIPVLLVEWIIGKFNLDLKMRSSLALVNWAFRVIIFFSGIKVTAIGEENVPKDRAVLYILNHRSYFDIVLTYVRVPRLTGYIAKKEMVKIPSLSHWMRNLNCLFLDRNNIKEGLKTILEAIEKIKSGISIAIFPEGTRNYSSDEMIPFHDGSFKIAEKSGCPIVPVTINNSSAVFEEHLPWIRKTHVIIEYGKPIEVSELSKEEKRALPQTVRTIIAETYKKNKELI